MKKCNSLIDIVWHFSANKFDSTRTSLLTTIEHLITVFLFLFLGKHVLPVFHPLHRNVLKEIPSCPETMKYSKWRICRHRSVPFPRDDRKGSGGIRGKRELAKYLKWSRVEALLSPSFIERQSKISGYSNAASHFWGRPLSSRRTPQVRFRSVTRVASVEAALNRF